MESSSSSSSLTPPQPLSRRRTRSSFVSCRHHHSNSRTPTSSSSMVIVAKILLSTITILMISSTTTTTTTTSAFVIPPPTTTTTTKNTARITTMSQRQQQQHFPLSVWSFGGTETMDETIDKDADSCELVPVRIERTSANSRRILGEITAPVPLQDVWAILTDYDRLAIHVPNLMESRITEILSSISSSAPGDGSFRCRLFQRGAQKVFGFEFGASVTMDMKEQIVIASSNNLGERMIEFKCHDSFFFSEFDGYWKAKERMNDTTNQIETILSYKVDVRPKGPVPVAALEWRIKEDVPTNLRSIRRAAMKVGYQGVMASRRPEGARTAALSGDNNNNNNNKTSSSYESRVQDVKSRVKWYPDETMAAYLSSDSSSSS